MSVEVRRYIICVPNISPKTRSVDCFKCLRERVVKLKLGDSLMGFRKGKVKKPGQEMSFSRRIEGDGRGFLEKWKPLFPYLTEEEKETVFIKTLRSICECCRGSVDYSLETQEKFFKERIQFIMEISKFITFSRFKHPSVVLESFISLLKHEYFLTSPSLIAFFLDVLREFGKEFEIKWLLYQYLINDSLDDSILKSLFLLTLGQDEIYYVRCRTRGENILEKIFPTLSDEIVSWLLNKLYEISPPLKRFIEMSSRYSLPESTETLQNPPRGFVWSQIPHKYLIFLGYFREKLPLQVYLFLLFHPRTSIRLQALLTLRKLKDRRCIPFLNYFLQRITREDEFYERLLECVAFFRDVSSIRYLFFAFPSYPTNLSPSKLHEYEEKIIDILRSFPKKKVSDVILSFSRELGCSSPHSPKHKEFSSVYLSVQRGICYTIGKLGLSDNIDFLKSCVFSPHKHIKKYAITALSEINSRESFVFLKRLVLSRSFYNTIDNVQVRKEIILHCLLSISKCRDREAESFLISLFHSSKTFIRAACIISLIHKGKDEFIPLIPWVVEHVSLKHQLLIPSALQSLIECGTDDALLLLFRFAENTTPFIHLSSLRMISSLSKNLPYVTLRLFHKYYIQNNKPIPHFYHLSQLFPFSFRIEELSLLPDLEPLTLIERVLYRNDHIAHKIISLFPSFFRDYIESIILRMDLYQNDEKVKDSINRLMDELKVKEAQKAPYISPLGFKILL